MSMMDALKRNGYPLRFIHCKNLPRPVEDEHASHVATKLFVCKMEMNGKESIAVVTFQVIKDLSWTLTALGRGGHTDDFPCHERA